MKNNDLQLTPRQYLVDYIVRNEQALRRHALQLTHNEADAQDLYQETVLRSLNNSHHYIERNSAGAWLRTIMHNIFINEQKQRQRLNCCDVVQIEMPDDDAEGEEWQYVREQLISAVDSLPRRDRDIIHLRMMGASYRDIAERLNIHEGTVKSSINRIKKRLAHQLRDVM